jgi:CRP-like cAMP-binding protein/Fe-S-cluster-containing hydrogenase component 2
MPTDYLDELRQQVEREVMACIGCNDCMLACPLPETAMVTIAELNAGVLAEGISSYGVLRFVEQCTQCRQCVPVCPADLHRADMVLYNKMKVEDVAPDRVMPMQVGPGIEASPWTLDVLATHLASLPLFQGVEVRHLRRMLLAVTLRRLEPREVLCREGSFHERMYVVLDGAVEQTAHSARGVERILLLGPGSFHGEMAVMGNQQEPFTISAVVASTVVEFPKATVVRLMTESSMFRGTMEELYRRRALWTHARSSPLLSRLGEDVVDRLLDEATFRVLEPGDVVYREGDPAQDLYIVRAGFLRVARSFGEMERVLVYFREGDVFGGTALLFRQRQSTTVSANTRTEVIQIPGSVVAEVFATHPEVQGTLTEEALRAEEALLRQTPRDRPTGTSTSRLMSLEGLLDEGVIQGHEVLLIDTAICTNCNNCVDACERRHGYSRLERSGLQLGNLLFPTACRHCEDPVCLLCSVNGIVREPNGEIRIVPDNCIGCGACAERCPYGNIQMHPRKAEDAHPVRDFVSNLFRHDGDAEGHVVIDRVAEKCDLCAGYPDYACVHACPVGAAMRVDPVAMFDREDLLIGVAMKRGASA